MEKNTFNKLFLPNVCLMSLLILGSTALTEDFSSEEEYENIKVLINSEKGLQFSKEDSSGGRKITYDCRLGLRNTGSIDIFDPIHPADMKSLIIKNCNEIDIVGNYNYGQRIYNFQELKISNVTSLELHSVAWGYFSAPHLKISFSNVQFLNIKNGLPETGNSMLSLKLENVSIGTVNGLLYASEVKKTMYNVHLKNVKINGNAGSIIHLKGNQNSILTVEDSHFEDVDSNCFVFKGTVKIINNTFSFLDEKAFSINATGSFIFSGNHVEEMLNPFYIEGSDVNIINNIFDSIATPWLTQITSPKLKSFRVLNITGNIINHWSHNLFYLEPLNFPDIIIFEGNYLNCSCKNSITLAYKTQNYIKEVFVTKEQINFCHNLGNCPLHKALEKGSGICSGTFRCQEDDQNEVDENASMCLSDVKSILSVLKNIDNKLDQIVSKYNSSLADKPN